MFLFVFLFFPFFFNKYNNIQHTIHKHKHKLFLQNKKNFKETQIKYANFCKNPYRKNNYIRH